MLNRRCFISSVLCVLRSHIIIFRLVGYQNEKKNEKIFQKEKQQKEQKRTKKKNHRLARKAQRMNAFEAH